MKNHIPQLRQHDSGRWLCSVPSPGHSEGRKSIYFGKGSESEARRRYDTFIAEWLQAGRQLDDPEDQPFEPGSPADITVAEMVLVYWEKRVDPVYRNADGTPSKEVPPWQSAMCYFTDALGECVVSELTVFDMEAWRDKLCRVKVAKGRTMARMTVIRYVAKAKRVIQWCAARRIIPNECRDLGELDPLPRSAARVPDAIPPVSCPTRDHRAPNLLGHCVLRLVSSAERIEGIRFREQEDVNNTPTFIAGGPTNGVTSGG